MESIAREFSETVSFDELPDISEVVRRQATNNHKVFHYLQVYRLCVWCGAERDSKRVLCSHCRPLWNAYNTYRHAERKSLELQNDL